MRMQGRAICHGCAIPVGLLGTSSRGQAPAVECSQQLQQWGFAMNRLLRIAGLILALTPLAYPYGNLLKAAEAAALWSTVAADPRVGLLYSPRAMPGEAFRLPADAR
jgi:hypothetical protein